MIFIRKNSDLIIRNAQCIYEKLTKHKNENYILAKRCYDFKKLENCLEDYKYIEKQFQETEELTAVTLADEMDKHK